MLFKHKPPKKIYLVFEDKTLLGCFRTKAAAKRLRAARKRAHAKRRYDIIPYYMGFGKI